MYRSLFKHVGALDISFIQRLFPNVLMTTEHLLHTSTSLVASTFNFKIATS